MTVRLLSDAIEKLADSIWFFKGFAAARPASIDEGAGDHVTLEAQTRDVKLFLMDLHEGRSRVVVPGTEEIGHGKDKVRIDRSHGGIIAITYAEAERLLDGLRTSSTREDIDDGRAAISVILKEWREQVAVVTDNSPIF